MAEATFLPRRLAAWQTLVTVAALIAATVPGARAQDAARPVYRCPGPPVLYTDTLSAQEARDRGCRTIEGAPVTIVQAPRPRLPASAPATT